MSPAFDANADVENGERIFPCNEDWLVDFETENLGVDKVYR
jgi:hypothetical protein